MKLFLVSALLIVGASATARGVNARFRCQSKTGAHTEVRVRFDAATPLLTETIIERDADGNSRGQTVLTVLSPSEACGVKLDFAARCLTNQVEEDNDFNWSFRCGEVFGDLLYLDRSGRSEVRCMGAAVDAKFKERNYTGCHLE